MKINNQKKFEKIAKGLLPFAYEENTRDISNRVFCKSGEMFATQGTILVFCKTDCYSMADGEFAVFDNKLKRVPDKKDDFVYQWKYIFDSAEEKCWGRVANLLSSFTVDFSEIPIPRELLTKAKYKEHAEKIILDLEKLTLRIDFPENGISPEMSAEYGNITQSMLDVRGDIKVSFPAWKMLDLFKFSKDKKIHFDVFESCKEFPESLKIRCNIGEDYRAVFTGALEK